jgi:hypothetical protein
MKATPIQAHKIASLSSARSSDRQFGLIRFGREVPLPDGQKDVWVAVPNKLLPYLATSAIKALPQPGLGGTADVPHVLPSLGAEVGVGGNGEIVLTVAIEQGATLSYRLDAKQAGDLLVDLAEAIADAKPGGKSTKKSNGKA